MSLTIASAMAPKALAPRLSEPGDPRGMDLPKWQQDARDCVNDLYTQAWEKHASITSLIMTWPVPQGQAAVEHISHMAINILGMGVADATQLAVQAMQVPKPGQDLFTSTPLLLEVQLDVPLARPLG